MGGILENVKSLAVHEGITITRLEQVIGASKGVLSRAIANNSDIQVKWITKIVENYPLYSCDWLIKNAGPMIKTAENVGMDQSNLEESVLYKDLADARKETIESLQKIISLLEEQVETLKKNKNEEK
ncbi:hypothetical protein [Flavobacterium johnsoniae]|jgi:hypothetical protein|uniref:XRE family transcriptional regulator n=1 Tax=Flavobacterium johnsoniae TaxID=986 RepID=A0A1M5FSL4_FLAJO|nr:hypothetical protein [Flavobacterium johnsoniae]SHF94181.1 hypothetical protein SAMN05444388_10167 [Flavobacterium johnsoniae]